MQRINRVNEATAPQAVQETLGAVKKQLGMVPNIFATMAQSGAVLGGYLGFSGALAGGSLSAKLREQIALTVAGANSCDYCASAHTALGGMCGLEADEMGKNLKGAATDAKAAAALTFAASVVATKGNVSDAELAAVRAAGFTDGEVVEIVANVAANIFTNYFNHVAGTEIDFPVVNAKAA